MEQYKMIFESWTIYSTLFESIGVLVKDLFKLWQEHNKTQIGHPDVTGEVIVPLKH